MSDSTPLDTLHSAQTPEGIAFTLRPAGPGIRFCAYFLDSLIGGTVFVILSILLVYLAEFTGSWIYLLLTFVYTWFYHTIFEIFHRGQTPGKQIMGLKVVMSDGSPVSPGASFMRNLLRFADTFMFLHLIAVIVMSISSGFRRLGDWAADTLVVYTRVTAQPLNRTAMPWLAPYKRGIRLPALSYEERQTILDFARRYPVLGKERAEELAALYVPVLRQHLPDRGIIHPGNADVLLAAASGLIGGSE